MNSKSILTVAVVLSVTFLSACGDNKSKKSSFRPRGTPQLQTNNKPGECGVKVDVGGRETPEAVCAKWRDALNTKLTDANRATCGIAFLTQLTAKGCNPTDDERKIALGNQPEPRKIGDNKDTPPNQTQEIVTTNPKTPTTPEEIVNDPEARVVTRTTDPETGNQTVGEAVPVSQANLNPANVAPVVPPADGTSTVPSAGAGADANRSQLPSTCTDDEKKETLSCEQFARINDVAGKTASSMDMKLSENARQPSAWATFVCTQSFKHSMTTVITAIKAELPDATDAAKCTPALSELAIKCSRAIKCEGTKTDVMNLARLQGEPDGPESNETLADRDRAAAAQAQADANKPSGTRAGGTPAGSGKPAR